MTGTEVALYDYAVHNETLLGNKSIVIYDKNNPNNEKFTTDKFSKRFDTFAYGDISELDSILKKTNSQLLYAIKSGQKDNVLSLQIPTMVHAVFPTNPLQIHGASYAYISDWLSRNCSQGKIPTVPHIVDLPNVNGTLRESLGIPENALVIGGFGGQHSFDIPFAISAVVKLLEQNKSIYFLFMNFNEFIRHPRAFFLPGTPEINQKVKFINSCDAMLHARRQGESFGLACGEFSIKNKPIITCSLGKHTHHIETLGSKGFYYDSEDSLIEIIKQLPKQLIKDSNWDCYSDKYNPQIVMTAFNEKLIQPALRNLQLNRPNISIGWSDYISYLKFRWNMHKDHRKSISKDGLRIK